jgi:hypothetical protein
MVVKFCTNAFSLLVMAGALFFNSVNASEWTGCHGCSQYSKEQIARSFAEKNATVRVNVLDVEREDLTTFTVTNLTEVEPGNAFSKTLVREVASTNEELEARDFALSFYHELQSHGTTIDAGDLVNIGTTYSNAGYLVNSNNAANVAARLNDYFSSRFLNSWNINVSQHTLGALLSAAQGMVFTVVFSDGSTATFALTKIRAKLTVDGNTNGFHFDFDLEELRDADGNVIPMTPVAASRSTTSVSGAAMGAWTTAFYTMGISFSGGGSSGSYTVSCTVNGDKVICTARRNDK